jgi:Bax protein
MSTRQSYRFFLITIVIFSTLLAYGRAATAWGRYQAAPHGYPVAYMPGPIQALNHGYGTPRWSPYPQLPSQGNPGSRSVPVQVLSVPAQAAQHAAPLPGSTHSAATSDLPANPGDTERSNTEKKQLFIEKLLPLVAAENERIAKTRRRVLRLLAINSDPGRQLDGTDADWLRQLARSYRIEDDPLGDATAAAALTDKVDIIPAGLAIAQAANESAWGNSRFAREGNNLFGIWTYDPAKGLKPKNRAAGKTHLVRVYDDIGESVRAYLHNLNSHPAYRALRAERARLRAAGKPLDAIALAGGLSKYSELGEEYVKRIRAMIRDNRLERLDHAPLTSA